MAGTATNSERQNQHDRERSKNPAIKRPAIGTVSHKAILSVRRDWRQPEEAATHWGTPGAMLITRRRHKKYVTDFDPSLT